MLSTHIASRAQATVWAASTPAPTAPGGGGPNIVNFDWITNNLNQIIVLGVLAVAVIALSNARKKVSANLGILVNIVIVFVIVGMGSYLAFGDKIAGALFG